MQVAAAAAADSTTQRGNRRRLLLSATLFVLLAMLLPMGESVLDCTVRVPPLVHEPYAYRGVSYTNMRKPGKSLRLETVDLVRHFTQVNDREPTTVQMTNETVTLCYNKAPDHINCVGHPSFTELEPSFVLTGSRFDNERPLRLTRQMYKQVRLTEMDLIFMLNDHIQHSDVLVNLGNNTVVSVNNYEFLRDYVMPVVSYKVNNFYDKDGYHPESGQVFDDIPAPASGCRQENTLFQEIESNFIKMLTSVHQAGGHTTQPYSVVCDQRRSQSTKLVLQL